MRLALLTVLIVSCAHTREPKYSGKHHREDYTWRHNNTWEVTVIKHEIIPAAKGRISVFDFADNCEMDLEFTRCDTTDIYGNWLSSDVVMLNLTDNTHTCQATTDSGLLHHIVMCTQSLAPTPLAGN